MRTSSMVQLALLAFLLFASPSALVACGDDSGDTGGDASRDGGDGDGGDGDGGDGDGGDGDGGDGDGGDGDDGDDTTVFPGIRYAGRLATDPLGDLSLGEATVIDGSGVQTTTNSRWGDYTSMNIDPTDDCTFWYVNEYYTAEGQASSPAGWQTRIASFKLPGCASRQ
jgi:hypothetical protein